MIQSYKQNPKLQETYHTICIGSGMGSLATAAILSKEGQKVLVLERHYTAGGFTHVFKRKGYEWDVGIHYIGEVNRPHSAMKKLFDYVTDNKLQWAEMGEVYDRIIIGEKSFDFVKGVSNFIEKLGSYFPGEEEGIKKYVDLVFAATKSSRKYYMDKAMPPLVSNMMGWMMRRPHYNFTDKTTYEVIRTCSENEELIKVLTGQYGDYGLPPKQSSFAMHASVARHYFSGGNFPVGGSSKIVETIDPVIESAGGTILVAADVEKVIIEKNKAVGVEMTDGRTFFAKNIVSGAGFMTTFQKLIPPEFSKNLNLPEKFKKVKRSVSHACLYIGLKGSPETLGLPKTNYWIYPAEGDHDSCVKRYLKDINQDFPVVYISFPSAKDPDWPNRYPDRSTIDIITLLPYEIFSEWDGSRWMKRGADYEELKNKISKRLLQHLYHHFPHLEDHIDHFELSSPLTTKHFVNYEEGEIYGLDHGPNRFRQKFLKPRTDIKNFYLTGQDIVTAGVGGALFSGVLTVSAMTGKNILKKILN